MFLNNIFLVIIGLLGLILNSITLYITGYRLRFNGIDLTLIGLIAIFDTIISVIEIVRMVALEVNWLSILNVNLNWCIFDSTAILVSCQTTIETVAVLGVLRYLAICRNKQFSKLNWFILVFILFLSTLVLTLYNSLYPSMYIWSNSGLICLPITYENAPNLKYFFSYFILMTFRVLVSLVIISFCYYKILVAYRHILTEIVDSVELKESNSNDPVLNAQSTVALARSSNFRSQIQQKHRIISIQLLGIALLYIICCTPIQFIHLFKLTTGLYPPSYIVTSAELLYATNIIINPLFVLISHEPSRRELVELLSKLFRLKSNPDTLENFPSHNY